jgi:translation initiation factor 2B subunit (eIF-2B alpha/beta/delta family)
MEQNSEAIANLGNLREEVEAVVLAGARDSVTAINSGIQNLQKATNDNLQKAVKAVETGVKKNSNDAFSKIDAIAWAGFFILGFALCFLVVQQYTVKLVSDNFHKQIQELAEEPRKEAEAEAKLIIAEAKKQANAIIENAKKQNKSQTP